ncbi:hypothetical protein [Hymenobacter sp. B81]|uniref:hypothetical protein n=1 Tax=Hymenobacter sp. B81 TaxID=3344878 RepID=UPI0037DC50E7
MPQGYVFGHLTGMPLYHWQHPLSYILLTCFCYGLIAAVLARHFAGLSRRSRVLWTGITALLTVVASSPMGGMLWHYHDMQAGYFPSFWRSRMVEYGVSWGLAAGWAIVGLSVPYNVLGLLVCYWLTSWGSRWFHPPQSVV